jgi:hypothetical protein
MTLRADIEDILKPAIDVRAPYAKAMVEALTLLLIRPPDEPRGLSLEQRAAIGCGNEPYADEKVCPSCQGKGHVPSIVEVVEPQPMRFDDFHNALRILVSIDHDALAAAGIMQGDDAKEWHRFRMDPFRWLIRADDDKARKLFELIELRQRPMFKVTEALRTDEEAAP